MFIQHTRIFSYIFLCLLQIGLTLSFDTPAGAEVSANFGGPNGGAIRPGWSGTSCTASIEGALRWNTSAKTVEMCDGLSWKSIVASNNVAALIITPATHSNMDISTSGTPAYGDYATFTVENIGNVTSQTISVTLSNAGNFEIGTNTCSGNTLATSATCTITVRPMAWGDGTYTSTLSVKADNTTIASLSGTATGSCGAIGSALGGGLLAACMDGYALIAMPAGCPDQTNNPTCTESIDTLRKPYGQQGTTTNAISQTDGQDIIGGNTHILMSRVSTFGESFPAAQYCSDMEYGGYTDWYLPSFQELRAACLNQANLPGFVTAECPAADCSSPYITSSEISGNTARRVYFYGGTCEHYCSNGFCLKSANYTVRCMRRQ